MGQNNDMQRDDNRRVDNMQVMNRGYKIDQYGPNQNSNQRRDDHYGR